jgi:hypothetical protein
LLLASAASFVTGAALALLLSSVKATDSSSSNSSSTPTYRSRNRHTDDGHGKYAGATIEGDDLSLFYGDVKELTTVTDARKFLPSDLYGNLVRDCVVCCVDCLLVRRRRTVDGGKVVKECLLVLRSSEPVKGVWWLPGGRLLKGETFFAAATRKAQQETGLTNVTPIQGMYSTDVLFGRWNVWERIQWTGRHESSLSSCHMMHISFNRW